MNEKVGVIGLWHLGCVISVSWMKLGYEVVGFDYEQEMVDKLRNGIPPLYEPNLENALLEGFEKGLLSFSSSIDSLKECDFVFLSYDTPVLDDDSSDTSILENSVKSVREVMKDGAILIVSSQSPVGYCAHLRSLLKEKNATLEIAYSPENLRLGEAIECYLNPGRIIIGTVSQEAESKCMLLFSKITDQLFCMSLESAEIVKHGINSYLAMSIVFANHLADICETKNARIDDVVKGLKSDVRIGAKAYLSPGIGFSGGTLGRDLKVLESVNEKSNGFAKLFGAIHNFNIERKYAIVKRIDTILEGINGKTISILGLTYKPGTSTLRRSLPLEIVDQLVKNNGKVKVYDPKADYSELSEPPVFEICKSMSDVINNSDILVLLTEWNEFKYFDWSNLTSSMNKKVFFDTKNCLDESNMRKAGFHYYAIGRTNE
ncbi:MAG: nucleotide sugar dehydrogenase [Bacteroidota bacterium]